jgi:transcriptional regulator with XRE-family HTH domain
MVALMASPLGKTVRRLRRAAGLTQQGLANAAGLSLSIVVQIERGTNADPRLSTLRGLAKALGCDVADLLGGTPPTPKRFKRGGEG